MKATGKKEKKMDRDKEALSPALSDCANELLMARIDAQAPTTRAREEEYERKKEKERSWFWRALFGKLFDSISS
jgi:hypothetical protein